MIIKEIMEPVIMQWSSSYLLYILKPNHESSFMFSVTLPISPPFT